jgi:hypothetical protein
VQAIAGNVLMGFLLADVGSSLANHDGQFHFPVCLHTVFRNHHMIVRANNGLSRFKKHNGFLRDFQATFLGMKGIVQANTNQLAWPAGRWAQTHIVGNHRARLAAGGKPFGQSAKAIGSKKLFVVIFAKATDINPYVMVEQQAWFFFSRVSKSDKFHVFGNLLSVGTNFLHVVYKLGAP